MWPDGILRMDFELEVGPTRPTFGFWLFYPAGAPSGPTEMEALINSFYTGPLPYFLDCMHSDCSFVTCRTSVQGTAPFSLTKTLAPNHGSGTAGQGLFMASGLYIQGTSGGRGSGSRLHLPGVPNEFTTDFAYLTEYGVQQLTFAATALVDWVATGPPGPSTPCVLGTLQQRENGVKLHPPIFDPAIAVTPTLRLVAVPARFQAIRGISTP